MNPLAMYPEHRREELIRERNQHSERVTAFHPIATVVGRLILWFAMTFTAFLAWLHQVMSNLTFSNRIVSPPEPDLTLVVAILVLFLLGIAALIGPGSPKELKLFGMVWGVFAGVFVIQAVVDLV
jgi:hypothetical protein